MAGEWLDPVVAALLCCSWAEPLPSTNKQTKVRRKGDGADRVKTNLERQLSLLRQGFQLIDFYFLALLSKIIISKEFVCPAPTESKLQHVVRHDAVKTLQHSDGFPSWRRFLSDESAANKS